MPICYFGDDQVKIYSVPIGVAKNVAKMSQGFDYRKLIYMNPFYRSFHLCKGIKLGVERKLYNKEILQNDLP